MSLQVGCVGDTLCVCVHADPCHGNPSEWVDARLAAKLNETCHITSHPVHNLPASPVGAVFLDDSGPLIGKNSQVELPPVLPAAADRSTVV